MKRATIVKTLSLAWVALSLGNLGASSALAATTATADTAPITQVAAAPAKQPKPGSPEYPQYIADQIAQYGDVKDKLISLEGTQNTRDIEGYQTADGKWQIRQNRILRSDNLSKLTDADATKLAQDHHVTSIVDFRTPGQQAKQPDKTIPGATLTSISVLGSLADTNGKGDGEFYNWQLEFGYFAVKGYHQFLNMMLTNPNATLYHCSSGKDRTGIATVLIMSILGMDRQTIIKDYLQSNQTGRFVDRAWLMEYYREIFARYGSMEKYITELLEFSPAQQEQLRAKYLVSTDGKQTPYPGASTSTPTYPAAPVAPSAPAPEPAQPEQPAKPNKPTKPNKPSKPNKPQASKPHKKPKAKVVSMKKLHTKFTYRVKGNKKLFKDVYLNKVLRKAPKKSVKKWQLVKLAKVKTKSKITYHYQIKDRAGHKAWVMKQHMVKVK
ncbi:MULTISPECIES: tyrosine-protein phosphatase [Lactobacillaceae]|uniref:tyrosine-protein phosphatase n=1 Tax=Lactobacillaceae TaxID=33958 RepID=UPI001456E7FF|nr:tyrosine-protein phosphatase [Lactobacillus sp. HBUAS51381]NLR09549.1 tyrosine-protein phosphatase [Lactobacillus sp. HBUAS51381]